MSPVNQRGVSLVELVVFIVVVGVAVVGVLAAMRLTTAASADPMIQKQALAIAEALLEEVQLQAFTYCDPDDANAGSAANGAGCTGGAGGPNDESRLVAGALGPETAQSEARSSATFPFDNVSDYHGYDSNAAPGIRDINGTAIPQLAAYRAQISVVQQGLGVIPAQEALLIRVTVDGPAGTNTQVVLDGYRVRYSPNGLP
jgi:MSHA pilin protein MshD